MKGIMWMNNLTTIGIWKYNKENETFFRDPKDAKDYQLWAKIPEFSLKKNRLRIVLIGESVARGYFYDPELTPAAILENTLKNNIGEDSVEVIDLARIDLSIEALIKLFKQSLIIDPDIIVIFAGNNWGYDIDELNEFEYKQLYMLDRKYIFDKLREIREVKMTKLVDVFFKMLSTTKIPILVIIPDNNLKDWKHNNGHTYFPLSINNQKEIMSIKDEIDKHLSCSEYQKAQELASKLIQLEPYSAIGYEYKAQLLQKQGEFNKARELYKIAQETNLYNPQSAPCCYPFIQKMLLEKSIKSGYSVVNLPEIFAKLYGEDISGDNLFLDYCHMNIYALNVAMNYIAAEILKIKGIDTKYHDTYTDLKNEKKSIAHFYAAIHCAHRGNQPYDIIYRQCIKAIQAFPDISTYMLEFLRLKTNKVPWYIQKYTVNAIENVFKEHVDSTFFFANLEYVNLDTQLERAIIDSLKTINIHIDKEIKDLRLYYHKPISGHSVNLLENYYQDEPLFKHIFTKHALLNLKPLYRNIIDYENKFAFYADYNNNYILLLTLRQYNNVSNQLDIYINDFILKRIVLTKNWQNMSINVDKCYLNKEGYNELKFICQDVSYEPQKQNNNSITDLLQKIKPVYFQIIRLELCATCHPNSG